MAFVAPRASNLGSSLDLAIIVSCRASRNRAEAARNERLCSNAKFTLRVIPGSLNCESQPVEILASVPLDTAAQLPGVRIATFSTGFGNEQPLKKSTVHPTAMEPTFLTASQ